MDIVIGLDIGGTNSRAAIAGVENGMLTSPPNFPGFISEKVASKKELGEFVRHLTGNLKGVARPVGMAVALAGPVTHQEVTMTNWRKPRTITVEELIEWGSPADRTIMVNDMEAGCHGLVKHLREDETASVHFEGLKTSSHNIPSGNRVFIAPGTGLGAAGIIEIDKAPRGTKEGSMHPLVYPIAAELQNTPMPILRESHRIVSTWLRREKHIAHPSWDDFVSGRGLVHTYLALRSVASTSGSDITLGVVDPAAAVAESGVMGRDLVAKQALSVFYTFVGRFCQLMALGFQAFGGIFIGGASTIRNRDFIKDSPLLDVFLDNPTQRPLLDRFPVYLVKTSDLNLDGALWLGFDISKK
uniref:Glucokinase n=1 Tax=Candidatus Kentrum sp. TC TaxID=2126339 RepID=A0A450YZW6_9GAMM|nr:MAG: Glucokinase [Candidatus Kentron sp. TC]VFK47070.1 MAG: glucokinase [Candidatus Kentron sp. TC]VFK57480.1 MAG: Glucokinase [Candidatus Kentron sp. TC]